jgi:hypothetical protein
LPQFSISCFASVPASITSVTNFAGCFVGHLLVNPLSLVRLQSMTGGSAWISQGTEPAKLRFMELYSPAAFCWPEWSRVLAISILPGSGESNRVPAITVRVDTLV